MAEIKSTLELVMERTRHLCMSEGDKQEQAAQEFKEALNRAVLKYLDGQIDLVRFQAEFGKLDGGPSARADAAAEIARRIDPAADNAILLDLIRHGLGCDISGIEAVLSDYRLTALAEDALAAKRIKSDLVKRGILGSAVVANLDMDKDRTKKLGEMVEAFKEGLAEKIACLRRSIPQAG